MEAQFKHEQKRQCGTETVLSNSLCLSFEDHCGKGSNNAASQLYKKLKR